MALGQEPVTDPTIRVPLFDANGTMDVIHKTFVSHATLLKILGGAFGVALLLGTAIAGWTVRAAGEASHSVTTQLEHHVTDEKDAIKALRAEQAQQIKTVDDKVTQVLSLLLTGTVRVYVSGGPSIVPSPEVAPVIAPVVGARKKRK